MYLKFKVRVDITRPGVQQCQAQGLVFCLCGGWWPMGFYCHPSLNWTFGFRTALVLGFGLGLGGLDFGLGLDN